MAIRLRWIAATTAIRACVAFSTLTLITTLSIFTSLAQSQAPLSELRGDVIDPRGDIIVGAKITITNDQNLKREAVSDKQGQFVFTGLQVGEYTLQVAAEGFAFYEEPVALGANLQPPRIRITLHPTISEMVMVDDDTINVALDPQSAGGAQVVKGKDIQALPDDPDQLNAQLKNLATSSGSAPDQAVVTVDGFVTDKLPPKSAIREVRINPDLYSAEYDKAPYQGGRIQVFTKPGATLFHGSSFFNFNDSVFNARDAFAPTRAPSSTRRFGLQLGGPIIRGLVGFFADFERRSINESAVVNALTLDDSFQPLLFAANVPIPKRLNIGSARVDWQINQANTLMVRFDLNDNSLTNLGVGGFNLPERGFDADVTEKSLRFSETSIVSPSIVNELRFGLTLQEITHRPISNAAAINVLGAFVSGGATSQRLSQEERRIEIADNFSIVAGKHTLKIGTQIYGLDLRDTRSDNFNGTFIFGGGLAPQLNSDGTVVTGPEGPALVNISGLEQYRRALLGLPGGDPTRFTVSTGNPANSVNQWRAATFIQDEWRVRQNLLLSLGLRYEGQTNPTDKISLAPRVGAAFSPDKKKNWVLRARAGLFYDRFSEMLPLEDLRLDGVRQQQILIDSPSFPNPFDDGTEVETIPTIRLSNPNLRPPFIKQLNFGFERRLPKGWKIQLSRSWSYSSSVLRSRNINAPLLEAGVGTPDAKRPLGGDENILQFESTGRVNGTVLFVGANNQGSKHFSLFSGYLLFDFHSDTDSAFMLPQSSYDFSGELARPIWQARHRAFVAGTINMPWKLRVSPMINFATGTPFNVTTGRDNNGDGNFNDRPSEASRGSSDAVTTRLGVFDPSVINGSLRRNFGTNPSTFVADLNVSRTFVFGKKDQSEDNGFQLTVNARVNNLLNQTNPISLNGVLASPFFGRANNSLPSRRIELGMRFSF